MVKYQNVSNKLRRRLKGDGNQWADTNHSIQNKHSLRMDMELLRIGTKGKYIKTRLKDAFYV